MYPDATPVCDDPQDQFKKPNQKWKPTSDRLKMCRFAGAVRFLYIKWFFKARSHITKFSPIFTARKRSLGQGNIFIGVCQEFCSQGGCLLPGGCLLLGGVSALGGSAPGGVCCWEGVCFQGGCLLLGGVPGLEGGCGLLLWPSGLVAFWLKAAFWYGFLGGGSNPFNQKAITEGHHTRRPYQKAIPEDHNKRPWQKLPTPPSRYCCGRYASNWNAFLFTLKYRPFILPVIV